MKRHSCSEAMSKELDQETCMNFRGVRQWVMCKAWEKESEGIPFGEAISKSWDEAIERCRAVGGSPSPEEKCDSVKATTLIDKETNMPAGKILWGCDELTVCFGGDCTTTKGSKGLYYIAQYLYDQMGYKIKEEHL